MSQTSITIFSTQYCGYCARAKEFFRSKGLPFTEVDLTENSEELNRLVQKTGHKTVPQIFFGEEFVGGYTELMESLKRGDVKLPAK